MRVAIVLGGGGVRGAAWLLGALHGLVEETGWDPADADLLIGTSAGALVAALAAAGAKPWDSLAPERASFFEALMRGAEFRPALSLRSLGPGSLPLAARAALSGQVIKVVAGLAPLGCVSTDPIEELVRDQVPGGWPAGKQLWVVATDFTTGDRVVFGRRNKPAAKLARAVAASCAVPGFYRPVEIGGRAYVDGGVHGANLELAAAAAPDLVICANPLSSPPSGLGSLPWLPRLLLHLRLESHTRPVRRAGSRVVLLEPRADSIGLIGVNPMSRRHLVEVGRAASVEVQQYLRRPAVRDELTRLNR